MHTDHPHAVVVAESMFGNTRAVADAVADALRACFDQVDVFDVADAPLTLDDVDLLVVGAPTHAFGMSRPATRRAARDQGAPAVPECGAREWIDALVPPAAPITAAVFDTRVRRPPLPGSAVRPMRRRLRRRGFLVRPPVRFTVLGTPGPLADGELDRARRWALTLAAGARSSAGTT